MTVHAPLPHRAAPRTSRPWCALAAAVLSGVALSGCGLFSSDSSESPTSPITIDGTYVGAITDSMAGAGTARMTVVASGSSLSGTWQATFPNAASNTSGTLTGSFSDTTLTATFAPSVSGACPWAVTMTRSNTRLSGTYAATNCNVATSGSLDLTKQQP